MYRNSHEDPVVKYYDETLAKGGRAEIEWYTDKVERFGGPVLDLACGTGRFSIICAKMGYDVTGIDNSSGMLSVFKKKLEHNPKLRKKIIICNNPMENFSLKKKFNSILCIDSFFHNLTLDNEINCLKCVSHHLTKSGRFFFNVHNFNPKFVEKCRKSRGKIWTERNKYWIRDKTEKIIVYQALDLDESQQVIITSLKFNRYTQSGYLISEETSKWFTHYRSFEHYKEIINQTGLRIENVVGSYKNGPINENTQLIFQIKIKD